MKMVFNNKDKNKDVFRQNKNNKWPEANTLMHYKRY